MMINDDGHFYFNSFLYASKTYTPLAGLSHNLKLNAQTQTDSHCHTTGLVGLGDCAQTGLRPIYSRPYRRLVWFT